MGTVLYSPGVDKAFCWCSVFSGHGIPDVLLEELSLSILPGAPPRTGETHGVLSVAPVTVQEESVPIYFLPFLDYGMLFFLSFSFFPFLSFIHVCVHVFPVCVHS